MGICTVIAKSTQSNYYPEPSRQPSSLSGVADSPRLQTCKSCASQDSSGGDAGFLYVGKHYRFYSGKKPTIIHYHDILYSILLCSAVFSHVSFFALVWSGPVRLQGLTRHSMRAPPFSEASPRLSTIYSFDVYGGPQTLSQHCNTWNNTPSFHICVPKELILYLESIQAWQGFLYSEYYPEGPSTQIVRFQGPKTIQSMDFGT